jgi:hypothetical protein
MDLNGHFAFSEIEIFINQSLIDLPPSDAVSLTLFESRELAISESFYAIHKQSMIND